MGLSKRVYELESVYEVGAISYHLTPVNLLGLCRVLYHKIPKEILYSVKGTDFNFVWNRLPKYGNLRTGLFRK